MYKTLLSVASGSVATHSLFDLVPGQHKHGLLVPHVKEATFAADELGLMMLYCAASGLLNITDEAVFFVCVFLFLSEICELRFFFI